ncbi:hypothetical protein FRB10_09525, partial [Haemophilus influenzae]
MNKIYRLKFSKRLNA